MHTGRGRHRRCARTRDGRVAGLAFADGEPARRSTPTSSCSPPASGPATSWPGPPGSTVGERGGVVVDDALRHLRSRRLGHRRGGLPPAAAVYGLVAPGYGMAEVVADRLAGGDGHASPAPTLSTKLKLLGVDVASFGDASHARPGPRRSSYADPTAGVYKKLVCRPTAPRCWAAILVGDAAAYGSSCCRMPQRHAGPERPERADPARAGGDAGRAAARPTWPTPPRSARATTSTKGAICAAIADGDLDDVGGREGVHPGRHRLRRLRPAGHRPAQRRAAHGRHGGRRPRLCEHFDHDPRRAVRHRAGHRHPHASPSSSARRHRPRLRDLQAGGGVDAGLAGDRLHPRRRAGQRSRTPTTTSSPTSSGTAPTRSCPGCRAARSRPTSSSPSARWPATSASTPRSPAASASTCSAPGSTSCPPSGRRLVDAGFESGHAYGKALRTVKSCVGRDLVPLRRAGLGRHGHRPRAALPGPARAPQDQVAVSGCARECAEAQSKDFGVIATERGWNLYVGGNGGMRPRARRAARRGPRRRDAGPRTSTASSCSTSAPPTGWSAPRPGSTSSRAASTTCAGRDRRRPRHRRRARGRHGAPRRRATSASGRPRSTTPSGWRGSCRSSTPTSPTVGRVRPGAGPAPAGRAAAVPAGPSGCTPMTTDAVDRRCGLAARGAWERVCRARPADPGPGRGRPGRRPAGRRCSVLVAGEVYALDNRDPFSGAQRAARGIVGDAAACPRWPRPSTSSVRPPHRRAASTTRAWPCRAIRCGSQGGWVAVAVRGRHVSERSERTINACGARPEGRSASRPVRVRR